MKRHLARKFSRNDVLGVGADSPDGGHPWIAMAAAGAMVTTSFFAGLRGNFLAGGLLALASPFVYHKIAGQEKPTS